MRKFKINFLLLFVHPVSDQKLMNSAYVTWQIVWSWAHKYLHQKTVKYFFIKQLSFVTQKRI